MKRPLMTRLEANRSILKELSELVEKHPDWRFHQILMNFDIETPGQDKFYEESNETLHGLTYGGEEK